MNVPEVHYARSGDVAIAYQVVGDGPMDIVFVRGTLADLLAAWDQPLFVDHVEGLASFSRMILFDKRGSGLSDPVNELPTLEARMDDVRAVLDALGSERAVLWAGQEGTRLAVLFAATYPERTRALVMYDPSARGLWAPDYPWARRRTSGLPSFESLRAWGDRDYLADRGRRYVPSKAHDERFIDWYVWYTRRSASPAEAVAFHRMMMDGDVRDVLPAVRCPTLVFHRAGSREEVSDIASRIEGAKLVEVPGLVDGFSWANTDANAFMLDETRRFVGGVEPPADSSTECSRRCCSPTSWARRSGRASSATRAGGACSSAITKLSAACSSSTEAVRWERPATGSWPRSTARRAQCDAAVDARKPCGRSASRSAPVCTPAKSRSSAASVAGIAVHTGARVAALAAPGEVLVSSTVKDLVAGSGIEFEERGEHELKGVPGTWRLYAVLDA